MYFVKGSIAEERSREDVPLHLSQFPPSSPRQVLRSTSHPVEKILSRKGAATFSVSRTLHLDPGNPRRGVALIDGFEFSTTTARFPAASKKA